MLEEIEATLFGAGCQDVSAFSVMRIQALLFSKITDVLERLGTSLSDSLLRGF